jgi:hypothetical protein
MIDSGHVERQVTRLARVRDEELTGLESGPAAVTLLASVVADRVSLGVPAPPPRAGRPRAGRPRARRVALAAAAAGVVTVAVVVGPSLLEDGTGSATSYANSAIDVTLEGRYFVARIKDPLADHARYVEAFRAVGKDVDIELVPVSPRLVGQLLESRSTPNMRVDVSTELVSSGPDQGVCERKPGSCTMVIRISADTTGTVRYTLGRAALSGEAYQDPVRGPGGPPPRGGSGGESSGGGN